MDALVSASLCFASKLSTTVSVYGSTALRQWVAPHLRRMPADLDLFAAVPDRPSFHRLCQTLADELGTDTTSHCTEHGQTISCHFRWGAVKFLDITMETPDERQRLQDSGDVVPLSLPLPDGRTNLVSVMARSEGWFYRRMAAVLERGPQGANRYRWQKDCDMAHTLLGSMVWSAMCGETHHCMPWHQLCLQHSRESALQHMYPLLLLSCAWCSSICAAGTPPPAAAPTTKTTPLAAAAAAAAAAAGVEPPPPLAEADFAASSYSVLELSAGQEQLQQELLARLLPLAAKHQHSVFCEVQQVEAVALLCGMLQAPLPGLRWVVSSPMASLYPVLHQMVQHYPQVRLCGRWRTDMTDVYDIARRQLDHGGTNFLHGYSKASVPEQLVGRWVHMRSALSNVLTEKYKVLIYAGWRITTEDIESDAIPLLQGSRASH